MMSFLGRLAGAPQMLAIGALAGYMAGASSAYMVLDAWYDFDGSGRIKKAAIHAETTIEKRLKTQNKDEAELEAKEKELEKLRKENAEGDGRLCILPVDGWLQSRKR